MIGLITQELKQGQLLKIWHEESRTAYYHKPSIPEASGLRKGIKVQFDVDGAGDACNLVVLD